MDVMYPMEALTGGDAQSQAYPHTPLRLYVELGAVIKPVLDRNCSIGIVVRADHSR
jgi:hypothetical protein